METFVLLVAIFVLLVFFGVTTLWLIGELTRAEMERDALWDELIALDGLGEPDA